MLKAKVEITQEVFEVRSAFCAGAIASKMSAGNKVVYSLYADLFSRLLADIECALFKADEPETEEQQKIVEEQKETETEA